MKKFAYFILGSIFFATVAYAGTTTLFPGQGGTGISFVTGVQSGTMLYGTGAGAMATTSTSTPQLSGALSYSGTLGNLIGGASGTISIVNYQSFTYATTTAWTGTTTIGLEVGYGETWSQLRCFTDAGTLGVDLYHASSHMNYVPTASTTIGTTTLATNNVITPADATKVDIGTPASSPKKITCTIKTAL